MTTPLEKLLQKDCPFAPYYFLLTQEVLKWLLDNVEDAELNKIWVESLTEKIDYYLFNYFYEKSGLKYQNKLLKDCTIEELEVELKKRKEQL